MTLFDLMPPRPLDLAVCDAFADGLPIVKVSRRKNGSASSLYLRADSGRLLRISDHVLPGWLKGKIAIRHADIMLSKNRAPSRDVVRDAMRRLVAGEYSPDIHALRQAAPLAPWQRRPRRGE